MEYKVELSSLEGFKAWSGALNTLNTVRERGGMTGSGLTLTLSTKH